MKILVTGASGFIGKNLIKSLHGHECIATYCSSQTFLNFIKENNLPFIVPYEIDLTSKLEVANLKKQHPSFDACIYLAANGDPATSERMPLFDLQSNSITLVNLLEEIVFDRFIYFSSGAVYHSLKGAVTPHSLINPTLPYAISNQASEQYLKFFHKNKSVKKWLIVRFFGAYGEFEPPRKIYSKLINALCYKKEKDFFITGDGKNLIDAMYVTDTVKAIKLMLEGNHWNHTLDLCSSNPLTIKELVSNIATYLNITITIKHKDTVPEYIEFYSKDKTMETQYNFKPAVSLKEGIVKLKDILERNL